MFEKLPSLLGFKPKFYTGGPARFHLPLLYDLVASKKPGLLVTQGFGDGQAFFTLCQAAREQNIECHCVAVRRERAGEKESDDVAWLKGRAYGDEFYGDLTRFQSNSDGGKEFADQSVDLLLVDDCDSGAAIRADLPIWESKLAPNGLVLFHGVALERDDDPKAAWVEWSASRPTAEFPDGIGLGITLLSEIRGSQEGLFKQLFAGKEAMAELAGTYRLAVARIEAQVRADEAVRAQAALEARQVWIDSLLADRWKVQDIMDYQARAIAEHERRFEALSTDETQAQQLIDAQQEQLKQHIAGTERLKAKIEQLKAQIKEQKAKERRPFGEKILREIRRLPRNLGISRAPKTAPPPEEPPPAFNPDEPLSPYAVWISGHEPNAAALKEQRQAAAQLAPRPKISLLVPVHNTPAGFLDEMFASVSQQTYPDWELCVVDGGSDRPETQTILQQWTSREPRIRLERSEKNLGISENSNRALALATGDFIACIDHDDLLAPFALSEMARAIRDFPDADILYSDEDRWNGEGKRHAPFFKPEWSPELLCSFMYLGHLTAYRRSLVDEIGGFRKEFDLSQDYDFALRATERARHIHHVPHVLYHWREHAASGSLGGKPDARKLNLAALGDAMRRRNLPAEIIEYPTANRARLKVSPWPCVSIIVPTDSSARAQLCLRDLPRNTKYPDLEIVLVTKSDLVEPLKDLAPEGAKVRFVPYDKPFNFSDKCNLGAEASTGNRLIFFNDDVEPTEPDWIQNVIEPLENPEVGAVSPKLLYETGKIQHAGLVMGVRGLAGTAFHERPADSTEHFNLAQSLRDVAALSAACLAMRRDDFFRLGGFDAVNTPIAHSDIDLCFKIREAGLRCVYTPFATLNHTGHVSLAADEMKESARPRNKASIYLLKRWARYATHDPFFPDNMRDWLYSDSPGPIRMIARDQPAAVGWSPDLLFVSHDLSLSGAPMMLFHAARWCRNNGVFVLVMAPQDGPLGDKLKAEGIPLIIDPLIETEDVSFSRFARDFDCIVANTILSWAVVDAMQHENVPIAWWLHEPASSGERCIRMYPKLRAALPLPDMLFAPSEQTAAAYRSFTDRPVRCLRNATPDLGLERNGAEDATGRPLRFLLLGGIEKRKGQDVFVRALASLPRDVQEAAQFQIAGRILDPDFWEGVGAVAATVKNFSVRGGLNHTQAVELMREADVVVSASRDEAMPTITVLEAMTLGKALIATNVGGAEEGLVDGQNALLVRPDAPEALAAAIRRLIEDRTLTLKLGAGARATYEEQFTIERFGAEFRELIGEVMAIRSTAAQRSS
jgi:GT2 family glycosyltransferase/uncharacterized protein (UPF0335 family)